MSYTIQQSINYAQTFIQYSPLAVGTGNEPALSIANEIQNMILNAPFTWGWNRAENTDLVLEPGKQDYLVPLLDFSFLEKVSLEGTDGSVYEIKDVYNTLARGIADPRADKQQRPQACCVLKVTYGQDVTLRFMGVPVDSFKVTLTYQKLVKPLSTLTGTTGTWAIPDQYLDIYNNLFVGEAMSIVDDARANIYRARGVAALITKSEGLSEMQINAFLEQYWMRDAQRQYHMGRVGLGVQASGA
jgi:hypothetical protein